MPSAMKLFILFHMLRKYDSLSRKRKLK